MTDEVLGAYYEAVKRFKSKDLVITQDEKQVTVYLREALLEHLKGVPDPPAKLLEKLSKPSRELVSSKFYGTGIPSFWFVVDIPGTEVTYCCAIRATRMMRGGDA